MVVDDEAEIAAMAKEMLEGMGYAVAAFTSAAEAMAAFSANASGYDLVITDLTMPGITGVELSRRLLEIRPDLPIILCSGLGETVSASAIGTVGIRRFLNKPILLHEYGRAVREVLDGRHG